MVSDGRRGLGRKLLDGWTVIAMRFGAVQTLLILALFYVTLIGPASIAVALARRDHLDKRSLHAAGSAWKPSESGGTDLERAKLLT